MELTISVFYDIIWYIGFPLVILIFLFLIKRLCSNRQQQSNDKKSNHQSTNRNIYSENYINNDNPVQDDKRQYNNYSTDDDEPTLERTCIHEFKLDSLDYSPSVEDLNNLCSILNSKIYDNHTDPRIQSDEQNYETIAAGYSIKTNTLFVAANIKERFLNNDTNKIDYRSYGIKEDDIAIIFTTIREISEKRFNKYDECKVEVVTTKTEPRTKEENAAAHAEMVILKNKLVDRIGISKPPCKHCKEQLEKFKVKFEHNKMGNQNPKNYRSISKIKVKNEAETIIGKKKIMFKWTVKENFSTFNTKKLINSVTELKYSFNVTLNSSTLLDILDNYDRKAKLRGQNLFANYGKYSSDRTRRKGASFSTGLAKCEYVNRLLHIRADAATVSANAEYNRFGVSAGIDIRFVSLEMSAGPAKVIIGLKTGFGFSAGVDGIEIQFFGVGASVGPKVFKLKLSIIEIQLNPNILISGLIFGFLEIHSKVRFNFPDLDDLVDFLIEFFNGLPPRPPPPPAAASVSVYADNYLEEPELLLPVEKKIAVNNYSNPLIVKEKENCVLVEIFESIGNFFGNILPKPSQRPVQKEELVYS